MNIEVDLCVMFVGCYNRLKEHGITFIPDTDVAKYILIRTYNQFVKEGLLSSIEDLDVEEKKKLVAECREMKDVFYTNETLIRNCKILHVINLLNNQ